MNNAGVALVWLGCVLLPMRATADACALPVDMEFERQSVELRTVDQNALALVLNRAQQWPNQSNLKIGFAAYAPPSEAQASQQRLQLIHGREASLRKWFIEHGVEESSLSVSATHELSVPGSSKGHGTAEVEISFSCLAR